MELVNRVAKSGVVTIKLEEFFPAVEVAVFDLKDYLFMELILKEKDFRAALEEHDWQQYEGKQLVVTCSADAIIPVWAYMLVSVYATPHAVGVFEGTKEEFYKHAFAMALRELDGAEYTDKRVVIKGCSEKPVPVAAYVQLTSLLRPYAKRIMYGEPCSTVPLYKKTNYK
ncbi:MAG: DUF2480 family protein [Bacteroidota bacterium]